MSLLHERIQFFSTRNPTQKDFQEMVNGARRIEDELNQVYKQNNRLTKDLYNSVDKRMKVIQWLEQTEEFRDDVLIRTVINRLSGELDEQ